jgi:4-hydroxybenzoate polyprenyltransferase
MAIIIVGLFDLMPAITSQNQETQLTIFKIVLDYAMFAFGINLVREIVKDHQDIKGDQSMGLNTLPIALGENRSKYVALALLTLFIAGIAYYVVTFLYKQELAVGYFAVFVIAPLIYAIIKLFGANNHKDYAHISMILKVVMFLGMLSLLIYPFVLK